MLGRDAHAQDAGADAEGNGGSSLTASPSMPAGTGWSSPAVASIPVAEPERPLRTSSGRLLAAILSPGATASTTKQR